MKKLILYWGVLALAGYVIACNQAETTFSPGPADARIAGTWRLYERRFPKDSLYRVRIDTLVQTRDTLFFTVRRYPASSMQTLTFGSDGKLSASGSEMTYYYPIQYFRLDSTFYGLALNLFITTNRSTQAFRQTIRFRRDTLLVLPQCSQGLCDEGYYLKFLRMR